MAKRISNKRARLILAMRPKGWKGRPFGVVFRQHGMWWAS